MTHINRSTATTCYMLFVILITLLFSTNCSGQTTVKTDYAIKANGIENFSHSLDAKVVFKTVKGTRILVTQKIVVTSEEIESSVAQHIEASGMYDFKTDIQVAERKIYLYSPNVKPLMVRGKMAKVEVHYIIYMPEHIMVGGKHLQTN